MIVLVMLEAADLMALETLLMADVIVLVSCENDDEAALTIPLQELDRLDWSDETCGEIAETPAETEA